MGYRIASFFRQLRSKRNEVPLDGLWDGVIRISRTISVLDIGVYELFNDFIKRAYEGSSGRQGRRLQKTVLLL